MSGKIPATVVTGFLGAGKTTLIQNLLRNANGRRLALIINEFGETGVDGEIVKGCKIEGCPEENIVELANGCICCTVADDFLPTMRALLDRPNPPEHIVIETSGLALPKPPAGVRDYEVLLAAASPMIEPMPTDTRSGTLWMLGSTLAGAAIGAQLGVPYAFAGHFAMRHAVAALAHYRTRYEPSQQHPAPYAMLAVTAVCAETDEAAERLAAPLRVAIVKNRTGRRAPIVPIEEALAYKFTAEEQAIADEFFTGAVIGGPAKVAAGIQELARDTGADEIMVSALLPSLEDRTKSLTLIARALA